MISFKKLLFVAVLLPLFSFGQGNYKPGFVIDSKGDTVKGYIDLKEWGSNPTNIYFKTSQGVQTPEKFNASNIRYFEILKAGAYRAYVGPISLDPTNVEHIERFRDTASKVDTIFLKVVQSGKNVILYSYTDYIKKRFFIYDNKTNKLAELVYRIYFVENDINHVTTVSQNGYKQQLLFISQQYDTYSESLEKLFLDAEYDQIDLTGICRKINGSKKG